MPIDSQAWNPRRAELQRLRRAKSKAQRVKKPPNHAILEEWREVYADEVNRIRQAFKHRGKWVQFAAFYDGNDLPPSEWRILET